MFFILFLILFIELFKVAVLIILYAQKIIIKFKMGAIPGVSY